MPDANGRFYFSDYKQELRDRGFDGYSDADLGTYVNRGYFAVARKSRWYWERTTDTFTLNPGSAYVDLWPVVSGELPYFRSLDAIFCTTTGQRRKLKIMSQDTFLQDWLYQDLTVVAAQGEPTQYVEWDSKLYILNPPAAARTFVAYYHRVVVPMVNPNDQPITPPDMDEVIIDAARVRAHTRASEIGLAQLALADVEEAFDDMRDQEETRFEEDHERTTPDDSWL